MKKLLLAIACFTMIISVPATAQVVDGFYVDHIIPINFSNDSTSGFTPDTSATPLWQFGNTYKPFFATDSVPVKGMMTDTVNPYPVNANNYFILNVNNGEFNPIVNFWHRFQTTSQHDGGAVEFSIDGGLTWQNVKGACNTDGTGSFGVLTTNFYSANDTLITGEPSFNGIGDTTVYSRFQFLWGYPIRATDGSGCSFDAVDNIYVRFRFISDSVADSLAGWVIDSVQIEYDYYGSSVAKVKKQQTLNVCPNPSHEGIYTFPALDNEQLYNVEIYDAMGSKLLTQPYTHLLNLNQYARGMYFYRVTDGTEYYSGRLLFD